MSTSSPQISRSEAQSHAAVGRLIEEAAAAGIAPVEREAKQPFPTTAAIGGLVDALLRSASSGAPLPDTHASMLGRAIELELEMRQHDETRRAGRRAQPEASIERLLPISDPATLLRRVASECVAATGARRALFSRIGDGVWSAASWSTDEHRPDAPELPSIRLERMLLEWEVAQTRRPALVADASDDSRIHPAIRDTMDTSFVVVPVAPNDTVIGLLHVDRLGTGRAADEADRELAWGFAEGFGRLYERATLRHRLRTQRAIVEATARAALEAVPDLGQTIELSPTPALRYRARLPLEDHPIDDAFFTRREREVADLMVSGLSNAAIGKRLVVEPATVKSHVRIILRKLGASNRAQAVALYLRRRAVRRDEPGLNDAEH